MLRDNKRCDGLIGDYRDGLFMTGNPYFQDVPNALQHTSQVSCLWHDSHDLECNLTPKVLNLTPTSNEA